MSLDVNQTNAAIVANAAAALEGLEIGNSTIRGAFLNDITRGLPRTAAAKVLNTSVSAIARARAAGAPRARWLGSDLLTIL